MERMKKGFTLVEMIVVIAVVIILSSVSIPIYKDHTNKAKLAEGYALLGAIRTAQENYFVEYGVFLPIRNSYYDGKDLYTCNDDVLQINARTNKYFTCFYPGNYNGEGVYNKYRFWAVARYGDTYLRIDYDITSGVTYTIS